MSDTTTKTKVLDIQTGTAQKNVKTLREQIKELKNEMAQLEKGTEAYERTAQQLANLSQKQIEINEAQKYSNKDLGASLSSLTKVSAGVIGAISGINSVMVLMGADSEEAQEAMKKIQALMALIQGLGAIDTATKALKGLTVAFKDFNTVKGANAAVTAGAATSELLEAGALTKNTVEMHKNNEEGKKFNELNKESADRSRESALAIAAEKEAMKGNTEETKNLIVELEKLNATQKLDESNAQNLGYTKAIEEYQRRITGLENTLQYHSNQMTDEMIQETKRKLQYYQAALGNMIMSSTTATDDIMVAVEGSLNSIINNAHSSFEDMEEDILTFNTLLKGLPFDVAQEKAQQANDFFERCIASFQMGAMAGEEGMEEAIKDFQNLQYILAKETSATLTTIKEREIQQAELTRQIAETTAAEDAETASIVANDTAKKANAKSTEELAIEEKKLADEAKKTVPIHKTVIETIKKGWKGLITFIKANPVFAAITGAVGAFFAIWKTIDHYVAKANEEYRKMAEYQLKINTETETQRVEMESLLRMYTAEGTSMKEKEVLAKEINKLANDEVIARNKVTGELEINSEKLREYNLNLRNSIELEYHKQKIQDLLEKEEEARNNALNERTKAIGKLFRTENGYLKEAAELVAEQEKHWKEIEKLTAGTVSSLSKQQTKNTPKNSGVVKAFKDIIKEIKELIRNVIGEVFDLNELKMRYNGVYTETEILLNKINKAVQTKDIGKMLSKEFNDALKDGKMQNYGITFDFIYDKDSVEKFEKELQKEKEKLEKLLKRKSGASVLDKEVQAQKAVVEEYNKQITAMKELADAVQSYADAWDKITKTQKDYTESVIRTNRELKIEKEYQEKRSGGDQNAESEKSIKLAELQLKYARQQFEEDKKHRDLLKEKADANQQNQKVYEDYLEYEQKTLESEKAWYDAMTALDNEYYNQRQDRVQQLYSKYEEESEKAITDMSKQNNFRTDYNTDVLNMETQQTYLQRLKEQIKKHYNEQLELHKDDADQTLLIEQEKNAAMLQLDKELADKQVEIDEAKMRRRAEIAQTYVNLYQNLSSQMTSLIGAEMEQYDENSAKYKKLRYMQGVIDVGSGTLSAFMSGIESGVPWPGNLITAFAMAGLTFATGLQQLQNIKNGTLGSAPAASSINFGEYDTLSYAQNSEILSNIKDQRVWVTEQDITTTQNRVRVMENQSTF